MRSFYGMLGLTFKLKLSTRPDKYMGEIETWNAAEAMLKEALDEFSASSEGITWELNEGDGAFYGPKIDIAVLVSLCPYVLGKVTLLTTLTGLPERKTNLLKIPYAWW